ncbi:MAG TPA: polysaccharide deacetylase family protein [Silvibacterium sp.]|nr:polysaccharide deacetylase family protein [Silvibacterium sp.]
MPGRLPTAKVIASVAVTGVAAGGFLTYAALSAGSQIFGRTLIANRNPNEIALTFDDGPNDPYTFQLLDILSQHQIRATFFMIGRFVRQRPDIVRAVHAAGHLIGNHTMTHPWLVLESPPRVRHELADCNAALEDILGEKIEYFRPPHGARRPDILSTASELGLTPVMWNVIGYDWKPGIEAATIQSHLEKGIDRNRRARRSSNIVLHDGGQAAIGQDRSATVDAVSALLPKLVASGASFKIF